MAQIVVGIDGSDESKAAFRWALEEARLRKASVRAVHAWHDPYTLAPGYGLPEDFEFPALQKAAQERLAATVDELVGENPDVTIEQLVLEGRPASILVEAAEDADLLVVGSRGHGGFAGLLLGSVSQQCAHHATCPVVIVRRGAAA
jgi:nucleotide-binding universal stress UspA family protein